MIVSFRHKGLKLFYETRSIRGIQATHAEKLELILGALDLAIDSKDLMQAAFRTHALKGPRRGSWSIWVNGNWRVTFRFIGADVELVDYEDYH